jgi:hypothetical protein
MQSYIRTASSPKLVCILNLLSTAAGTTVLNRALRTIQYLISYTLTTEDYIAVLPISHDATLRVLRATHTNVMLLNTTLDMMITSSRAQSSLIGDSTSRLNDTEILDMLTARDGSNSHLPHSRVLIAIVNQDIDADFTELLQQASDLNSNLQVVFFSVGHAGAELRDMQNVVSLTCNIGAVAEHSDVDVKAIANRATKIQSYLNYLATASMTCMLNRRTENWMGFRQACTNNFTPYIIIYPFIQCRWWL